MAQACDGFSKGSLMGNWYEERLAPAQPCRDEAAQRTIREEDASIAIAAGTSDLKPLPRIKRQPYWVTKGVTPNDGFQEFRSNQDTQLDPATLKNYYKLGDQRSIIKTYGERIVYPENSSYHLQTQGATQYKIINKDNLEHVKVSRNVPQNTFANHTSDFASTFRKHEQTHQQFFGQTTYNATFGSSKKTTIDEVISKHQAQKGSFAGTNERPLDQQSIRAISTLTGELYKNKEEPKDNTNIQRQWLAQADKAIVFAQKNIASNLQNNEQQGRGHVDPMVTYRKNMQQTLPYDIATSLPLGDGAHSLQPKQANPGQFRHIRSDVTRVMNNPITKK